MRFRNLYIPIWLYSNPSPIIPSIQDILNPIFCLPGYSQVQNYYRGCILLLLNIHLPLFYNICRSPYMLRLLLVDKCIYVIVNLILNHKRIILLQPYYVFVKPPLVSTLKYYYGVGAFIYLLFYGFFKFK